MTIDALNDTYGLPGTLRVYAGEGGFPCLQVDNVAASARVSLYGGQVLSYRPVEQAADMLFVSKAAYFSPGKAIKGGIPICWPWFGPDPESRDRPAHGFARNRLWRLLETRATAADETRILLGLDAGEGTRSLWPHDFSLRLTIDVGARLSLALETHNRGPETVALTQALHTYFAVADIREVSVTGLDATDYLDKAGDGSRKRQSGPVRFASEVDRIYCDVGYPLHIEDPGLKRRLRIDANGSRTAVVWNPWQAIAARMGDLEDTDYTRFLCVETANAADEVVSLAPGGINRLQTVYAVERQ